MPNEVLFNRKYNKHPVGAYIESDFIIFDFILILIGNNVHPFNVDALLVLLKFVNVFDKF
jgi:hypothetical protein